MDESPTPKRLLRSRDDRYIGGVAAGVANYFSVDPTLVRIVFVLSLAFGGIGLLAYVALLALMPIEGPADEPLPPIGKQRRNLVIGAAVVLGALVVFGIDSGGFSRWIFGFGPGPLFGILLWTAALIAAGWLVVKLLSDGGRSGGGPAPGRDPTPGTVAPAPSQNAPTAAAAAGPGPGDEAAGAPEGAAEGTPASEEPTGVLPSEDDPTDVMPGPAGGRRIPGVGAPLGGPEGPVGGPAAPGPRSTAGSIAGKVMTVIAVGITALIGLSLLALFAAWVTAQFGSVPMALLVIVLGAAMILAGIQGRRRLSIWLLAAALTVTVPMSIITLADLRIDGSYGSVNETPTLFGDIPADGYSLAAGRMVVDLRDLPFRAGKTVDLKVDSGLGATSVIVPDRVCVTGRVAGRAGAANIRGRESSGIDISREIAPPRGDAPRVDLDADFKLGVLEVVDATDWETSARFQGYGPGRDRGFDSNRWEDLDRWDDLDEAASRQRADRACLADPKPRKERNRS